MNQKPLIIDKLYEMVAEFPEYSFGQILYSMLRELPQNKTNNTLNFKKSVGFNTSDKDLYSALNRSLINEKEDQEDE